MSYERTPGSLLIAPHPGQKIDEELRHELSAITEITKDSPSYLDYLKPDAGAFDEARERALNEGTDEVYDAIFDVKPGSPVPTSYLEREERLLDFRQQLHADLNWGVEDVVSQLYLWRVNELIAETRMMQAVHEGDQKHIRALNRFMYGRPNEAVFAASIERFRQAAVEAQDHKDHTVRTAAQTVLNGLPASDGDPCILGPSEALFQKVRKEHFGEMGYFTLLLAGADMPEKGPVKPDVGEPVLAAVTRNVGLEYFSRATGDGAVWGLDPERSKYLGPEKYAMPLKRFIGLPAGHEIGSHGLELANGLRSILGLAAHGLDRYDRGNEGRAVIREQVPYDTFADFAKTRRWEDIIRRHLATGFLAGMFPEGTTVKEFVTTLQAIDTIFEFGNNTKDRSGDELCEKAEDRTWKLVKRVLGRKIYKDMYYLEGNIDCWNVAERIASGDLGKFDITNSRHTDRLEKLGVL